MRELRDLRRGRVLIGANEAAVHTLLPLIGALPRRRYPDIAIDVRRVPARQIAVEVQQGSLDFGALTFHPAEEGLLEVPVGTDELVLLVPPSHPLAKRRQVTMEEVAREPVVAHNDPSPARERVLRLFEQHHIPLNMVIALPSLDGIKRAVELKLGVALLPRRCAITEIASGRLVAVPVAASSRKRQVRWSAGRRTDRTPPTRSWPSRRKIARAVLSYQGRSATLVTCSRSGGVTQKPMHRYAKAGCGLWPRWNLPIGSCARHARPAFRSA